MHDSIPTDGCDAMALVEVGLARLKLGWLLQLTDVLDKDFAATRCKKILFVRVELE